MHLSGWAAGLLSFGLLSCFALCYLRAALCLATRRRQAFGCRLVSVDSCSCAVQRYVNVGGRSARFPGSRRVFLQLPTNGFRPAFRPNDDSRRLAHAREPELSRRSTERRQEMNQSTPVNRLPQPAYVTNGTSAATLKTSDNRRCSGAVFRGCISNTKTR